MVDFDGIKLGLASAEVIRSWSKGEVKKPETINYRSLRPEKDGLFCERIFGPTKDYECYCGKYKRARFKGVVCEKCGVEVTTAKVRRERRGHIELAAPVAHVWYFKGVPSRMAYLLDLSSKELERVLYFAAYIIIKVDRKARDRDLKKLTQELELEISELKKNIDNTVESIKEEKNKKNMTQLEDQIERKEQLFKILKNLEEKEIFSDIELYHELGEKYGSYFKGGTGGEAIRELLSNLDIEYEILQLKETIENEGGQKKVRAIKRLKVFSAFRKSENKAEWMILDAVPVIPPELRPMVQLEGGRFATSDLNDMYRRVINRNNRLKRLLELNAPKIIINNEKRMLQEAVDSLFDNSQKERVVLGHANRPLKSLTDSLKGKHGRFRQNLLGKRVDYSGRSVIVIGPELKLNQCGLPRQIAIELFKPFIMEKLIARGHASNIKIAKRIVEKMDPIILDILEDVVKDHPVFLNRAPTLHRLGIQAFDPVLIEGKAIQIHPLVCAAFNADFDGDQMAVHLPLSLEARAEAKILMHSTGNLLSPAHGRPLVTLTQDMILGCHYLTVEEEGVNGEGKFFSSPEEAILAYEFDQIHLHAKIDVRINEKRVKTTVGRIIFNNALPDDYGYINSPVTKKEMAFIVSECIERYDNKVTVEILDKLKELGFHYATKAGITVGIDDIKIPPDKWDLLKEPEEEVKKIEYYYKKGFLTDQERYEKVVSIWNKATQDVTRSMEKNFEPLNPIFMMAKSGARGNIDQLSQLAGMRGLFINVTGNTIDIPVKANFREGLSVLEYFTSTHGGRKGLADTALKTANAGYLTRRLVDVAQSVIVTMEDCGTKYGISLPVLDLNGNPNQNLLSRATLKPVRHRRTKEVILPAGKGIRDQDINILLKHGIEEVVVRTVFECEAEFGVCALCYGISLATGKLVDIGEAVGIIAAQSIGEPGTQLTLRTFHTGGVVTGRETIGDITHGLPRVIELFTAQSKPKGQAVISEIKGKVKIHSPTDVERERKVVIKSDDGKEKTYTVTHWAHLKVKNGDMVYEGTQITEGSINPNELLKLRDLEAVERYLIDEIQEVYKAQGVEIHDKHIEIIVREMLRRVAVESPGDSDYYPSQIVDKFEFKNEAARIKEKGGKPPTAKSLLLGITKASLATESFLSAASFQETTRVLTEAAFSGKRDYLRGLKENVIIAKLIPAGTGTSRYRDIDIVVNSEGHEVAKAGEIIPEKVEKIKE